MPVIHKTPFKMKINFYTTIYAILAIIIIVSLFAGISSCSKEEQIEVKPHVIFPMEDKDMLHNLQPRTLLPTPALPPQDWQYNPPQAEPIISDTTCTDSLYLLPEFVTGFMEIDEIVTTTIEVYVWPHHATAATGEEIPHILDSLLREYDPSMIYRVYQSDTDWRRMAFIAEGTNEKEDYHGEVFLRFNGHNSGWGFGVTAQAFLFAGALTFDEYMEVIGLYPSVNYFNNRNTNWTPEQEVSAAVKIRRCHLGRYWADFRFNSFPIPDSIVTQYEEVNWTYVLH